MDINPELDLLQGVNDAGAVGGGLPGIPEGGLPDMSNFQMPSMDKILEIIQAMDMPAEEKAALMESLSDKGDILSQLGSLGGAMGGGAGKILRSGGSMPIPIDTISPYAQYYFFFAAIAIIILLFVFTGYKLYKSLIERERRKEEKRMQKQQKKKK